MDEYIKRSTAAAEIMAAYADGRIATVEDIIGVLDLVPAVYGVPGKGVALVGERTSSETSEPCPSGRGEGCGACEDEEPVRHV